MSSRYQTIRDEIDNDPLTRNYAAMTDAEVAASLNTEDRTRARATLSASEIFEAIDVAEYKALATTERNAVDRVLSLGDSIQIGPSSRARAFLLDAFGPGTDSRTNLATVANETISRATEIGVGAVKVGHVQYARSL